jgi:beclin 1
MTTTAMLSEESVDISSVSVIPKMDYTMDDSTASVKQISPERYESGESGNGFTLIGKSEPSSGESLSHQLRVTSELFDILSCQSNVDHPLCEECTDNLLDQLDQQLKTTEDECKDYRDFLVKLNAMTDNTDDAALDEELRQLEAEEEALKLQLEEVESSRSVITEKIAAEKEKGKKLNEDEQRFYKDYNEYKRQLLEYEDAQKSVDNQLKYAKTQLEKLTKTNVFNTTFHIWHKDHFGTINNFRLGRLPNIPVEWSEINAAWGQTVLLLHSLANKMNLTFERYRLVPYGSHSYIESLTDKSKELPLYGAGGFKFFWDTKFDQAMVAFLDCLQQFKENVEKGDASFCLPYKMDKGRIEDPTSGTSYSVKIQFNSEEQWTKALKFMLTNLKWGLAWVSSQFANK